MMSKLLRLWRMPEAWTLVKACEMGGELESPIREGMEEISGHLQALSTSFPQILGSCPVGLLCLGERIWRVEWRRVNFCFQLPGFSSVGPLKSPLPLGEWKKD